jgi:hypothetical protein
MPSCSQTQFSDGARYKYHLMPVLLCVAAGLALSTLPFALWWSHLGTWIYIADDDNLYYLQLAAQAYYNHAWHISDPAYAASFPSAFPAVEFVPAVIAARVAGLGPFSINIIWHVWAGIAAAVGTYFIFWRGLKMRWAAAFCAILLLSDSDHRWAEPVARQLITFVQLIRGSDAFSNNLEFDQFRVVHPGLLFPLVLVQVGLLSMARERPGWVRILLSGVVYGAVFYDSFYFWTAIALGLAIAFALDSGHRSVYLHTAWIGGVIGLPSIVQGIWLRKLSVGLPRISLFLHVPRTCCLILPKAAILLLLISGLWIWFRRRSDLLYIWSLALAGMLLTNHQVVSGLELHNTHWTYFWGPLLSITVIVLAASELLPHVRWTPLSRAVSVGVLCAYFALGMYLRAAAVADSHPTTLMQQHYVRYQAQRLNGSTTPLAPNSMIAGDESFCDLAVVGDNQHPLSGYAVLQSPRTSDAEWETRVALNGYMKGASRSEFLGQVTDFTGSYIWGPWSTGEVPMSALIEDLMHQYDVVTQGPSQFIDRYHVRFVALPATQAMPTYLETGWTLIQSGPSWRIWEKEGHADEG